MQSPTTRRHLALRFRGMKKARVWAAFLLALLLGSAKSEAALMPHGVLQVDATSPIIDNPTDDPVRVWVYEVNGPADATWIRLHFDKFRIGPRDYVRFIGADGSYDIKGIAIDRNAGPLNWGEYYSLFFNGGAVMVELWAKPGSFDEGVRIDFAHYGLAPPYGGSDFECAGPMIEGTDQRVGRLIAMKARRDTPGEFRYEVCSATVLFPGDCILTDGDCILPCSFVGLSTFCVDMEQSGSIILEFDVPPSLGDPDVGAVQHPSPNQQYRLKTDPEPGVDDTGNPALFGLDYGVFLIAPNEKHGYSYDAGFSASRLERPDGGEAIVVEGFPERHSVLNHTQTKDESGHTFSAVDADGDVEFADLSAEGVGEGSAGGPLRSWDDTKLYGIANEPACVAGNFIGRGFSFRSSALDPEDDESYVSEICDTPHGYVDYPMLCMTVDGSPCNDDGKFEAAMHLPGITLNLDLAGIIREKGGAPILRYDNRYEIDTEMLSLDLAGLTCLGPARVRLSTSTPSLGLIRQATTTALYPCDSYFDVFLEIDVNGALYTNHDPLRISSAINSLPAYGDPYLGPPTPVTLYDQQGAPVGDLGNVRLTLDPARECHYSSWTLATDVYGTLSVGGTVDWIREATIWDDFTHMWKVPVEIAAMDLRGINPALGPYIVRESTTLSSIGGVLFEGVRTSTYPYPGAGFFDVFLEIELPQQGKTLYNRDPIRFEGTISGFPPTGQLLTSQGAVVLYDRTTEQPVGSLAQATEFVQDPLAWTPPPPPGRDGFCATGRVIVDLGQGPVTIGNLAGAAVLERESAVEQPDGMRLVPTKLMTLGLQTDSSPLGPTTILLEPDPQPAIGSMLQLEQGAFFPAQSTLDLRIQIRSPQGILHNTQPFRIQAQINELWEPEPDPYSGFMTGIQLVDQNGTPRGSLLQIELQPETFYDPDCPMVLACGQTVVGVDGAANRDGSVGDVRIFSIVPNPSAGAMRIAFELRSEERTRVGVYDVSGRLVRMVTERRVPGGARQELTWDGTDHSGRQAGAGIYFVRLETGRQDLTRKVTLLR